MTKHQHIQTQKAGQQRNVHFSSQRLNWRTPKALYQILDIEFSFDFDPCPTNPTFDGLSVEWGKSNFVNPPYGREIPKWMDKGYREAMRGKTVVFLIPSRTDTRWWHDYCMRADEIRFVKGRLRFDDHKNSAPFPSAIVIFNKKGRQNHEAIVGNMGLDVNGFNGHIAGARRSASPVFKGTKTCTKEYAR